MIFNLLVIIIINIHVHTNYQLYCIKSSIQTDLSRYKCSTSFFRWAGSLEFTCCGLLSDNSPINSVLCYNSTLSCIVHPSTKTARHEVYSMHLLLVVLTICYTNENWLFWFFYLLHTSANHNPTSIVLYITWKLSFFSKCYESKANRNNLY
jgi:hypothetical protein